MNKLLTQFRKPSDYGKVAVLLGGKNSEREISILSGESIHQALISKNIDAVKIDPSNDLYSQLKANDIDRVFIALHGRDGEDGVVQGFLKILDIPFTGSDTASSALAMNKQHCKQIWQDLGLVTAEYKMISKNKKFNESDAKRIIEDLGSTLFVKPVREGSSVGMSKATNSEELIKAVLEAQKYDEVMVEQFVKGKEYTVSIVQDEVLPSIRMETPNRFYDYQAKYFAGTTEYFCPSGLDDHEEQELRNISSKAFNALGCSGWGRVDFIRDESNGEFVLLEVNTVPGMTKTSLVPKSASAVGIDFSNLVISILESSFVNRDASYFPGEEHG